eukprot:TRINITY_DN58726_c0_g1_i1.p1 TRINITY_DN58726_c0_g1~~TRINITY_DN58726_c0_g1_i1.p1  ORF type:complete len:317 (-),score=74.52 TRINITY_DN58726_c0_g1_i1:35-985(-)
MTIAAKLVKSDLRGKDRKRFTDAVTMMWDKHVTNGAAGNRQKSQEKSRERRWEAFARALKASLDKNLGAHWHVLCGTSLGYACKKRNNTMGVWRLEDCMVLIWKSPGIEEISPEAEPAAKEAEGESGERLKRPKPQLVQPEKVDEDSELGRIWAMLNRELSEIKESEGHAVATQLRQRLTTEFGTIWHVVAGTSFAMEAAENARNMLLISTGKLRVACFQHEQMSEGVFSGIDFALLLEGLPYLLAALVCFAYMGLAGLCKEGAPKPKLSLAQMAQEKMCYDDWQSDLAMVGAVILGGALVTKRMKGIRQRVLKSD